LTRRFFWPLLWAFCLAAGRISPAAAQALPQQLSIYAATSLTDVVAEMTAAFRAHQPEVEFLLNFASSSTLAAQLLAGAPADIFASANEAQMQLVVDDGRIAAAAVEIFAHNQLLLITPADNPAGLESVADLATRPLLLVLAAPGTPIRAYTDAMLASYATEQGADFPERVHKNLVSEESNVRQVLARVALGEADAGIVYQSDAWADAKAAAGGSAAAQLYQIPIAPLHNQQAAYPIAPLVDSPQAALAAQFIAFALSEEARQILAAYGFCPSAILDGLEPTVSPPEPEPTPDATQEPEAKMERCASAKTAGG